jgi:nicotinate-nucleotide pyrophosphorylase (carboxylating)
VDKTTVFDMILLKENHVALAGGIGQALKRIFANNPSNLPVEIDVRNVGEIKEALHFLTRASF